MLREGVTEFLMNGRGSRRFLVASRDEAGLRTESLGDEMQYVWRNVVGNAELTALVSANRDCLDDDARWGLMFRDGVTPDARYVSGAITNGYALRTQYRDQTAAPARDVGVLFKHPAPIWIRLSRHGDQFTTLFSTNNVSWTARTVRVANMPATMHLGMFATSDDLKELCGALFENVRLREGSVPPPWVQQEVGVSSSEVGQAQFDAGKFTVRGVGSNLDEKDGDRFHFVYVPIIGDVEIQATLGALSAGAPSAARSGVMLRSSTSEKTAAATVLLSPDKALRYQVRIHDDDSAFALAAPKLSAAALPVRVRLRRIGNVVSAAVLDRASDTWVPLRDEMEDQLNDFTDEMLVGLAVSAGGGTGVTGTFEDVVVRPLPPSPDGNPDGGTPAVDAAAGL